MRSASLSFTHFSVGATAGTIHARRRASTSSARSTWRPVNRASRVTLPKPSRRRFAGAFTKMITTTVSESTESRRASRALKLSFDRSTRSTSTAVRRVTTGVMRAATWLMALCLASTPSRKMPRHRVTTTARMRPARSTPRSSAADDPATRSAEVHGGGDDGSSTLGELRQQHLGPRPPEQSRRLRLRAGDLLMEGVQVDLPQTGSTSSGDALDHAFGEVAVRMPST